MEGLGMVKIIQKKGEKVFCRFEVRLLGQRYRKTIKCNKADVKKIFRRWEKSIIDGELDCSKFFEKLRDYLSYVRQTSTLADYKNKVSVFGRIKGLIGNIKLTDIKPFHIMNLQAKLIEKGLKPASINRYIFSGLRP